MYENTFFNDPKKANITNSSSAVTITVSKSKIDIRKTVMMKENTARLIIFNVNKYPRAIF
ncbi:hypothetical protein ES703_125277 [subsurface metagenome]